MSHKMRTVLAVALQLLILAAIAGARQWTLATGTTVLLATQPVDPRDLFRGDYVTLNYRISTLNLRKLGSTEEFRPGYLVYVGLEQDGEGKYWHAASLSLRRPEGLYLRGRVSFRDETTVRVSYGIESYFVPEGTGRQIEQTREPLSVEVIVSRDGSAQIRRLFVGNTPFPSK